MGKKKRRQVSLTIPFAVVIFFSSALSMLLHSPIRHLLFHLHILVPRWMHLSSLLNSAIISVIISSILTALISRRPLRMINRIIAAIDRVAEGDYSVRIEPTGAEEFRQLAEKFNHMTQELDSVEMLRSDFVSNFSHEFKTPIVSIRGFARMLQRDDLTEAERREYLDIILRESERLNELSANILSLSRLEQQTALSDRTTLNISEQIRLAAALLEQKWEQKNISLQLDCDEVFCTGSKALLKQVWINLLDNAIKFSPDGSSVEIAITQTGSEASISFTDHGEPIPAESIPHIFDKFYQGDSSHGTEGNGLGLPIARRITELHGGQITVQSDEHATVFTVSLPL